MTYLLWKHNWKVWKMFQIFKHCKGRSLTCFRENIISTSLLLLELNPILKLNSNSSQFIYFSCGRWEGICIRGCQISVWEALRPRMWRETISCSESKQWLVLFQSPICQLVSTPSYTNIIYQEQWLWRQWASSRSSDHHQWVTSIIKQSASNLTNEFHRLQLHVRTENQRKQKVVQKYNSFISKLIEARRLLASIKEMFFSLHFPNSYCNNGMIEKWWDLKWKWWANGNKTFLFILLKIPSEHFNVSLILF